MAAFGMLLAFELGGRRIPTPPRAPGCSGVALARHRRGLLLVVAAARRPVRRDRMAPVRIEQGG